ncbi:MAG: hypothetical protein ACRENF_03990, partial [Thermodesulfobacteriota bacterium]
MTRPTILALCLLYLTVPAFSLYAAEAPEITEQYLCVAEKTAGVQYDESVKEWVAAVFRSKDKYIISRARESFPPRGKFQITKVGDKFPMGWCDEGFNKRGVLQCTNMVGIFAFNQATGRFLYAYD